MLGLKCGPSSSRTYSTRALELHSASLNLCPPLSQESETIRSINRSVVPTPNILITSGNVMFFVEVLHRASIESLISNLHHQIRSDNETAVETAEHNGVITWSVAFSPECIVRTLGQLFLLEVT